MTDNKRYYYFTNYELSIVPKISFLLKQTQTVYLEPDMSYYSNMLENSLFSQNGMYLIGILYNLTFDKNLFGIVPDEYEEDTRFLLSTKGGCLFRFSQLAENKLEYAINDTNYNLQNWCLYLYKTYYRNELIKIDNKFDRSDYEACYKINPHHQISTEEFKIKYSAFYNARGELYDSFR